MRNLLEGLYALTGILVVVTAVFALRMLRGDPAARPVRSRQAGFAGCATFLCAAAAAILYWALHPAS